MATMSETLACAAGFFNGEGCTRLRARKKRTWAGLRAYLQVELSISQTDREVLDDFLGSVGKGKIYGPYRGGHEGQSRVWAYRVEGTEAREVLASIWPWLSSKKRRQAQAVLDQVDQYREESRQLLLRADHRRETVG